MTGMAAPLRPLWGPPSRLQQINSVAGDEALPELNWMKMAVNTRVHRERNGKTRAVGELELNE